VVQEHLGDAYLKMSLKEKALLSYRASLRLAPGNKEVQSKIDELNAELNALRID
jgi:cytochrome c-type biogenesis protein CcmH/NrfG